MLISGSEFSPTGAEMSAGGSAAVASATLVAFAPAVVSASVAGCAGGSLLRGASLMVHPYRAPGNAPSVASTRDRRFGGREALTDAGAEAVAEAESVAEPVTDAAWVPGAAYTSACRGRVTCTHPPGAPSFASGSRLRLRLL